jgi:hypothetical protein
MEPTEKEVAEAQMNDVFPALARLEKDVADNKESIRELFSDNTENNLAEEVAKIKTALQQHGILTN